MWHAFLKLLGNLLLILKTVYASVYRSAAQHHTIQQCHEFRKSTETLHVDCG